MQVYNVFLVYVDFAAGRAIVEAWNETSTGHGALNAS